MCGKKILYKYFLTKENVCKQKHKSVWELIQKFSPNKFWGDQGHHLCGGFFLKNVLAFIISQKAFDT
jgi:hypothetical protein